MPKSSVDIYHSISSNRNLNSLLPNYSFNAISITLKQRWDRDRATMLHKSIFLNVEGQDIIEELVTVSPDTSLTKAIALMNEKHSSCVAVTEAGKLQGIFTERDLVRLVAAKQDLRVAIADVIERSPVVVSSAAKVKLSQLVSLLKEHSIEHLPVLDGERIVGTITNRSLSNALCKLEMQIEDISDCKQAELALKESETRFFDMVNSFPFPVWVSDETGTCSFFNRAWLDFTGKTLEQELDNGWSQGDSSSRSPTLSRHISIRF